MRSGYAFNSSADFETVRDIKEQLCFVSYDINKDRKLANETTLLDKEYNLPDKTVIRVGRERYEAAECLFNPSLAGIEADGVCDMIYDSISVCEMDLFIPLVQNIMLTGGTTMFPGLSSRIDKEMQRIFTERKYKGDKTRVGKTGMTVHDPPKRKHAVFIGASFLANNAPDAQWTTKEQF